MKHTTKRISALLLALTLLLTVMSGCGSTTPAAAGATAAPTAAAAEVPAAEDPAAAPADAPVIEGLTFTEESPLKYATVFRLFRYEGGYTLIRIDNGGDFLVVPEGAAVPAKMDGSVTVLQQPAGQDLSCGDLRHVALRRRGRARPHPAHRHARVRLVHRRGR